MFDDEAIARNLSGFILGAVGTIGYATHTLLSHFSHKNDTLKKLRKEFQE